MDIHQAIDAFSSLSQETRLRICQLLVVTGGTGMTAGDIALALGVAQNTLSFHLAHLERSGLLQSRRQGRFIIYSAQTRFIDELILFMAQTCRPGQPQGHMGS